MQQRALPPESALAMPRHQLYEAGIPLLHGKRSPLYVVQILMARLFVLTATLALSYYGISEMYWVLRDNSVTNLQWLFLILFSINFVWISFAFSQAVLGFLVGLLPRLISPKEVDANFRTAILLPVYNESPQRIRAAIKTMRQQLIEKASNQYAFFILSDSNQADTWIHEEACFMELVTHDSACPIYYRRRRYNTERKAGNIADWVQRWGGAYEAMIVLDADSLMGADCLLSLSRRLAAAPELGLIQTLPTIVNAKTLYGRLQQFANHCYGPIYAKGLSAWHGLSSNFWGHNAIIRTKAFAESCCLPILPGKPPFGGHILSHDFIEAALLRRAGWAVRFDTDLTTSFEEAPPSLIDVLIRDRRWCQGNLQHFPFMFAQGFVLPTRLHIFSGIMSYLSAVFWLSLIIVGLAIAVQARVVRPEYFANPSLFPTWPVFDAERALKLFYVSMALVLSPKAFGWLTALVNIRRCLQFGGPILLTLSTLFEMLISALYAPVLMVSQFGVVYSILRGKDSGWHPQSRDDGALPWLSVARTHLRHTLFGFSLAGISLALSWELFYWLLPISAGLMLSIPLSWLSGGAKRSKLIRYLKLLRAPEENTRRNTILNTLEQNSSVEETPPLSALKCLLQNKALMLWHNAQLPAKEDQEHVFHAPSVTAQWKVKHAQNLAHLESTLDKQETMALLYLPDELEMLKQFDDAAQAPT